MISFSSRHACLFLSDSFAILQLDITFPIWIFIGSFLVKYFFEKKSLMVYSMLTYSVLVLRALSDNSRKQTMTNGYRDLAGNLDFHPLFFHTMKIRLAQVFRIVYCPCQFFLRAFGKDFHISDFYPSSSRFPELTPLVSPPYRWIHVHHPHLDHLHLLNMSQERREYLSAVHPPVKVLERW